MTWRSDIVVVGGGPVGACAAHGPGQAGGASVTLLEKETRGLPAGERRARQLRPAGAERQRRPWPLPARSARGCGGCSTAPAPSTSRRGRARRSCAGCGCSAPPRRRRGRRRRRRCCARCTWPARASTTSSPPEHGERWLFHHDGISRSTRPRRWRRPRRRPTAPAASACARRGAPGDEARQLFPGLRGELAGAIFFPEDGHLDPMLFTRAMAALAAAAGADVRAARRRSRSSRRPAACAS